MYNNSNMEKTEKVLKTTETMLNILQTNDGINKYLKIANINIKEKNKKIIEKLLSLLSDYSLKEDPIGEIIDTLIDIMEDNKIKLNEMIKLMNTLIKCIGSINITNIEITNEDFALLLKLIIIILDETDVINIDEQDEMIFDSIDSCVFLIDQFKEIKIDVDTNNNDTNNNDNNINNEPIAEVVEESSSCKCLCFKFRF